MDRQLLYMRMLLVVAVALIVAACASMGRPEGGPKDEIPPVYVRSTPAPGARNVSADRFTIIFNENVQIKDAMSKVVVSPPQKSMPKIMAVGRNVRIEMVDTLLPNTTYTIDFTDAISDLNEGNELDGFAFDFSTGDTLDSLCISGMVFEAATLEPAQGMLVGVHSNLSDTAITTLPFDRITRTNQLGQFTVRNLKPGSYRIFAVNDVNRDNKWDRSEDVAFYDAVITPTASRVEVTDTLRSSTGADSLVTRMETAFSPGDILLTWFNEGYKPQYMVKYERPARNRIYIEMGAPADSFPELRFVGGKLDGKRFDDYSVLNSSATRDTLDYWITDTAIVASDSLMLSARYLRTDTLDRLSWTTDTLAFNMRKAKSSKKKNDDKKDESTQDSVPQIKLLKIKELNGSSMNVYAPLRIDAEQPIRSAADSAFHLEMLVDTIWTPVDPPHFIMPDSLRPMQLRADVKWEPGAKYRLTVDSLGITDIYGLWNGTLKQEFTVKPLSEYSNITFVITGADSTALVQLLDGQDKPLRTVAVDGGRAVFRYVDPGTYYARLFFDRNRNGKYDTGNLADSLQPEETFYFSKKISLKKNWDVEQNWDIFELPVDMQKPLDIKKNKPKSKKGERDNYDEDESDDQYYDEFGNPSVDPNDPFGKRKNQRYNTLNGRDNNTRGAGSGYR